MLNASDDIKLKLGEKIVQDQYDSIPEIVADIRQMTYDSGPVKRIFYCPLVGNIDEAYGLLGAAFANSSQINYGEEAIAVLLKEMEDRRGQFCVILAGYKAEMQKLLAANPGFASRIQFTLDFPDYTREELGEIAKAFLSRKKYEIDASALERLLDVIEYYRGLPNFANARTVRNVIDQVLLNQNLRTEDLSKDCTVLLEDVEDYLTDENIDIANPHKRKNPIGFV